MEINFNNFLKEELTINDIQAAMEIGEVTSKELVMYYLHRIAKYDQDGSKINSILEINPDAIFIAEALDCVAAVASSNSIFLADMRDKPSSISIVVRLRLNPSAMNRNTSIVSGL